MRGRRVLGSSFPISEGSGHLQRLAARHGVRMVRCAQTLSAMLSREMEEVRTVRTAVCGEMVVSLRCSVQLIEKGKKQPRTWKY